MIPDAEYLTPANSSSSSSETTTDSESGPSSEIITVIYEQAYDRWTDSNTSYSGSPDESTIQTGLTTANFVFDPPDPYRGAKNEKGGRLDYSIMVHSVPVALAGPELDRFVGDLSRSAKYLFITTNHEDYYESFADGWLDFVGSIPGADAGHGDGSAAT